MWQEEPDELVPDSSVGAWGGALPQTGRMSLRNDVRPGSRVLARVRGAPRNRSEKVQDAPYWASTSSRGFLVLRVLHHRGAAR